MPESVRSIHSDCFYGCVSLQTLELPSRLTYIGDRALGNCPVLSRLVFPDFLGYIGNLGFSDCTSLQNVTMPKGPLSVGQAIFQGCPCLREVSGETGTIHMDGLTVSTDPGRRVLQWRREGRCQHCGGRFKGIFSRVCGQEKDYS